MRVISRLVLGACLWAGLALAQSPVTVTISPRSPDGVVPADFIGMSFGMKALLPDKAGAHFFSPTNTPLITIFTNLGIRHLRVGGTSVESPPSTPVPDRPEIDDLFAFVQKAHITKVIYSLPLLETNAALHYAAHNAALAKYIWDRYQSSLDSFALGNEPDLHRVYYQDFMITNFATYLTKWRQFATAITNAVPKAKFAGPDGGSGNVNWTLQFARAGKDSGLLSVVTEHFYVGGAGRGVTAEQGIGDILSPDWITRNQHLYDQIAAPILAEGLPYRFTEANDHYSGGVPGGSDTFAGALWALDFLHWWATHDTRGVDFHNTQWVVNDVITLDPDRQLTINPKGYGLKAFELSSHGRLETVTVSNPEGVNLTAYAVRGAQEHFVTLINKTHGPEAREAQVTLAGLGPVERATVMFLTARDGNPAAKTGVTLGGASISATGPWLGKWSPVPATQPGSRTIKVPALTAVIVRIPAP